MLFDPSQHESLTESAWSEQRARSTVANIVERTVQSYRPGRFWPRHPLDEYDSPATSDKSLWIGAAGVLWALDRLEHSLGEADVYDGYLADPDTPGSTGLMMGETGVVLLSWKLAPTLAKEQRLFELVAGNLGSPSNELFNGVPGTMLAALHAYELTRAESWKQLWLRCAQVVWDQFRADPELGCNIWIQYRRGRLVRSVGAGHGFASNVRSMLRGRYLLPAEELGELQDLAVQAAVLLALEEDGFANWPTAADQYWAQEFPIRVQWCHGAPGIVTSLCDLPREDRLDDLLRKAGDLIWHAGPLIKGAGICHGTAGNGYAFLALHRRFGDQRWLDRAYAFGAHAITQQERSDRPRHSLWTGDIGIALYLKACCDGFEGIPSLDIL